MITFIFFYESRHFSQKTGMQTLAPLFFPSIILSILAILALSLFVKSFLEKKKEENVILSFNVYFRQHWRVITMMVLFFIYIYLIPVIGFLYSSIPFLFIAFTILRSWKISYLLTNSILSVSLPFLVQWVFQHFLYIYLP